MERGKNERPSERTKHAREGKGTPARTLLFSSFFYVQNMDIKIVIGQIFASVKILLFGGNRLRTENATVTYELGGI